MCNFTLFALQSVKYACSCGASLNCLEIKPVSDKCREKYLEQVLCIKKGTVSLKWCKSPQLIYKDFIKLKPGKACFGRDSRWLPLTVDLKSSVTKLLVNRRVSCTEKAPNKVKEQSDEK